MKQSGYPGALAVLVGLWLAAAGLLAPPAGQAEVYKTVNEDGSITYTDQRTPDSEPVEIKEPNTAQPVNTPKRAGNRQPEADKAYAVSIVSPEPKQLFPNRLQAFTVSTEVTPALKEGHRLRLKIDGKTHSISRGSFQVSSLTIGEHTLQVEIIDAGDSVITQSDAITVFARNPG